MGAHIGQNLGGVYTSYGKSLNDRWAAMNQMLGGLGEAAGKAMIMAALELDFYLIIY